MDIVIASANKHKIEEFQKIFADIFQNIVSMTDAGFSGDVEETGATLFENALIKAKTVSEALGVPVLSDDTGLIAVALKNEPGVRSARSSQKTKESSQPATTARPKVSEVASKRANV